ncbi:spore coat protein CotJB [Rossellomorea marisflavi]|uniref:Spore coat protein CotJB n=1 Tax=Rossellomorea marisflavi TaxID=189381 RepID=A0A5D4RZ70_9BACI|nr:spore coat protein CotJB [Rossellomorea marisflavi]TYS56627.1 spore coat protein CotJB [Rossellomorea marisflavi]
MTQLPQEYYDILEELQTVDFVIVELTLYLDTHPTDQEAISQFNMYVKTRKSIKKTFEKKFGPLTGFGSSYSDYPWKWKEAPWPWQV